MHVCVFAYLTCVCPYVAMPTNTTGDAVTCAPFTMETVTRSSLTCVFESLAPRNAGPVIVSVQATCTDNPTLVTDRQVRSTHADRTHGTPTNQPNSHSWTQMLPKTRAGWFHISSFHPHAHPSITNPSSVRGGEHSLCGVRSFIHSFIHSFIV